MNLKKWSKKLFFFLFLIILSVGVVYAETTSKINFCDYGGVRRTFKIIGIIINLVKIVVPLILMASAMVVFFKTIVSGKIDDFKASLMQVVKQGIAGLVIFCIPGILDFAFDSLLDGTDFSSFTTCTNCLLDTDKCTIPDKDPEVYINNKK